MYGSDWLLSGYASREWIVGSVREYGRGPLWNPNVFTGLPAGNPYTLLTLLYLILPVHVGWTYLFVFAAFLAGLGTYLYLKELKLSPSISLLCAIAYMGCGSLLSMTQPGHDGKILAAALFPLTLLFLHKALARKKLVYFLLAGGVGGICAVHGHFQLTYYAGVVCAFYLIFHLIWQRKQNRLRGSLKLMAYSVLGVALAGGLAMIKFLPVFGAFGWGSRGGLERGYEFATSWSLPTTELLDLLTPHFSGVLSNYWGENYFKLDTQYLGILPLLLALVGIVFKARERYVKFFLGLGIVATIFSLGKYTPFYKIPYYLFPHVSKFRGPSMAFYLTAFGVVILAAFGLQALGENLRSQKRLTLSLLIVFGGVLLFTFVCVGAKGSVLGALKSHVEPTLKADYGSQLAQQKINNLYQNYPHFLKGLGKALFLIAINSVLIVLLSMKKLKLEVLILLAFTVLLVFDQWSIDKKFLRVEAHPDEYYAPDAVVRALNRSEKSFYRVFPLVYEHTKDGYLMLHGIQSVAGYVANPFHRYQELIGAGKSVMFQPYNLLKYRNIQDILNAQYVISVWLPEDLSQYDEDRRNMIEDFKLNFRRQFGTSWEEGHKGLQLVHSDQYGHALYENERALPRVWVVPDYEVLKKNEVLERLKESDFDPRMVVILEEDPGVSHQERLELSQEVTIVEYEPNRIVCSVNLATSGFLVFSENWHPDWKAYVDGVSTKLYIANYSLRAIRVSNGRHTVELVYDSIHFKAGAWISSVSFLFLVGTVTFFFGTRKRGTVLHNRKQSK